MAVVPLASAYEQFLSDANSKSLLSAIREHGGVGPSPELDCPIAHRICDIKLDGCAYRVVRVYDVDDASTRLFIYPTDTPGEQPGVPYSLQGAALHQWVVDELENPTDDETDWDQYLRLNA